MHILLAMVIILAIFIGPNLLASRELRRHSTPLERLPGTGGELAAHLVDKLGLTGVAVELSSTVDHYDPEDKAVRLVENNFNGKSLTAIAVAAHEVGHAIQDYEGYAPLRSRTALVKFVQQVEKAGSVAIFAIPVVAGITRSPTAGFLLFLFAVISLGSGALAHIVTLPVEWDASFKRALPVLIEGGYISGEQQKDVRKILRACALTYLAASLAGIFNVWRWIAILRR